MKSEQIGTRQASLKWIIADSEAAVGWRVLTNVAVTCGIVRFEEDGADAKPRAVLEKRETFEAPETGRIAAVLTDVKTGLEIARWNYGFVVASSVLFFDLARPIGEKS